MFNTFTKCCSIIAMFALYFYSAPAALAQCDANEVTLDLIFSNYAGELSWDITDADGNVVASEGPYANGDVSAQIVSCLEDGLHSLNMYDSYGDGMCCTYGEGSYSLTDSDGNVLASGASFGYSESTLFALGAEPDPLIRLLDLRGGRGGGGVEPPSAGGGGGGGGSGGGDGGSFRRRARAVAVANVGGAAEKVMNE